MECHWTGYPFFMCGDEATHEILVRVLIDNEGNKIEEEFLVCGEHAQVMTLNAIAQHAHVVVKPVVMARVEWSEED